MVHSAFRPVPAIATLVLALLVSVGCRESYDVDCLETPNDSLCLESCERHPDQEFCNDCSLYPERPHCGDAAMPTDAGTDSGTDASPDATMPDAGPQDGGIDGGPCGACPGARPHCQASTGACVACTVDDHCGGDTPACNTAGLCVACLSSSHCSGDTPVCDTEAQSCVGCLDDGDCDGATPHCDTSANTCVACLEADHCGSGAPVCDSGSCAGCTASAQCTGHTPSSGAGLDHCDVTAGSCEACTEHTHCPDAAASQCGADNTCAPCTTDAHCAGNAAGNVCDSGTCVQCNADDESACGTNVCDLATSTCTMTPAAMTGLCQECVSDRQCMPGQGCVPMTFDGAMVGNFCLWRRDSMEPGGPRGNCGNTRPYFRPATATSLSGAATSYCHPSRTTCEGLRDFRTQSCTTPFTDDATCGVSGLDDGLCREQDGLTRCTYECVSDEDCRGTTCNLGAAPNYCNFF